MKHAMLCLLLAPMLSGCVGLVVRAAMQAHKQAAHKETPSRSTTSASSNGDVPAVVLAALDRIAAKEGGVTAIVMRDGKRVFRVDAGGIAHDAQLPVASASKWVAAALVMTLVDEGKLALDAPISTVLPSFDGAAGTATLRELLAQTSGEGDIRGLVDVRQDPRMTLAESAADVARQPLADAPGTSFRYGGPGFQVAGAMAEAVTGRRWADLFDERIARPLGMTHSTWKHLPDRGVDAAHTSNPLLQGGLTTTAEDYVRFVSMLAQRGAYDGHRVLSESAVETMETVQTLGVPIAYAPPGAHGAFQYALGSWCEKWNAAGRCTFVSSPGAFGTFPWIDRNSGYYGVFFMRGRLIDVVGDVTDALAAITGSKAQ